MKSAGCLSAAVAVLSLIALAGCGSSSVDKNVPAGTGGPSTTVDYSAGATSPSTSTATGG